MAYTTINDPEKYFQTEIYTGNGTSQSLTLDGDTDLQPDMVWIKSRSAAENHVISDSVRGDSGNASGYYQVYPNTDGVEYGGAGNSYITALNSDGFSVGNNDVVNTNTQTYVAWNWKESADSGMDIVAYTGDGVIGTTVAHSLSAKPEFILIKARAGTNADNNWYCWHTGLTANNNFFLNTNAAQTTDPGQGIINTTQNTSNFGFYSSDSSGIVNVNEDGTTFIAYLFAPKQGFSKFGTYTGNGNADGTFVYTGFKPAFLIVKRTNNTGEWGVFDNKRNTFNKMTSELKANAAEAEEANGAVDFLSNGFKLRDTAVFMNGSGDTYMYAAFAEAPFVNSNGVPNNAR